MKYDVSITSLEQLNVLLNYDINKLYIPFDLFYSGVLNEETINNIHSSTDIKIYLALPRIMRERDELYTEALRNFLLLGKADGLLIRNLEQLGYLMSIEAKLEEQFISINGKIHGYTTLCIDTDSNLYTWNQASLRFNLKYAQGVCAPLELTIHELADLQFKELIIPIYGRNVLMVSANCVKKTTGNCTGDCTKCSFEWTLADRMKKQHLVYCNCIHCYNEIYNAYITSYHKQFKDLTRREFKEFKIDFTNETENEIRDIMNYYLETDENKVFPLKEYTQGHILKGTI